ncbi:MULTISPECIES: hypothetical protein [Nocardioides]|uniref:DUF3592 domain-containing protein n=1 Tax=Nocardioides vastitatis TaxID=2568655 RepID=A0ABW0ZHU3_9ACTN|nr:hypothetical protein [Nocardioides sp.]THI98371.1 hypothetical protein E7Z54_13940 [Nocardioides sp.]
MTSDSRPRESLPMRVVVNLLVALVLLIPLVLVGAGGWLLYQRQFGERVEAEVLSCEITGTRRNPRQHCVARWTEDGVERTGPIQASGDQEVGETVSATLGEGELYSRSLALPLILLGLGLPMCFFPYAFVRGRLTDRKAARDPA